MVIDRSKSNLKVKKYTKKKIQQKTENNNRRNFEKEILNDANVIFGIDNGATGSIACIISDNYIDYLETPVKNCIDYTKEIQYINRIDYIKLQEWFEYHLKNAKKIYKNKIKSIVILERPMVNPQRFKESRACIASV